MTATVNVDFIIRTGKGSYSVAEAQLEVKLLKTALQDIDEKQTILRAVEKTTLKEVPGD